MVQVSPGVILVGAKGYGARHLETLLGYVADGRVELLGVVDPQMRAEDQEWPSFGAPPIHADLGEALRVAMPDAVVIATPPHTHAALTNAAIDAGAAVYLEKPCVPLLQDLAALITRDRPRRVDVGYQQLRQSVSAAGQALEEIGSPEVLRITAFGAVQRPDSYYNRSSWAGKWFMDGRAVLDGPLFNPLAHITQAALSIARMVGPEWTPSRVEAQAFSARDIEGDDTTSLRILADQGPPVLAFGTTASDEVIHPTVRLDTAHGHIDIINGGTEYVLAHHHQSAVTRAAERVPMEPLETVLAPDDQPHPLMTLEASRAFTTVVNAAVQAVGAPRPVEWERRVVKTDALTVMTIPGIASRMTACVEEGVLLTEVDGDEHIAALDLQPDYAGLTHPLLTRGSQTN